MNHPDRCPKWADELIRQIAALEIKLGNIADENAMRGGQIDDLLERAAADFGAADEAAVEKLFVRVSRGLTDEGFTAQEVASIINSRIKTGVRLPYCDASEVEAALL